jgi:hypothetical protein
MRRFVFAIVILIGGFAVSNQARRQEHDFKLTS